MLTIPEKIYNAIKIQALNDMPNETCGYLGGTEGLVSEIYPMTNIDHSPEHFSLDPQEQFAVLKKARAAGLKLLSVYHSHPETPARMSEEDIRLANDPDTVFVIYSVAEDNIKGFCVDRDKNVQPVEVKIQVDKSE